MKLMLLQRDTCLTALHADAQSAGRRTLALMEAAIWTVMLLPMDATCWNSTVE